MEGRRLTYRLTKYRSLESHALPYWEWLRQKTPVQSALRGINAAVLGLLIAALYNPVWSSSIRGTSDMALALVAFGLLMFWKLSPFYGVVITALGGVVIAGLSSAG